MTRGSGKYQESGTSLGALKNRLRKNGDLCFYDSMSDETNLDRFCINCSIGTFVARLREVMNEEGLFLRFGVSSRPFRVDSVETGEMGIHLRLHGLGPYFIPVEMVECDTFFRFEVKPEAIVPGWMIS